MLQRNQQNQCNSHCIVEMWLNLIQTRSIDVNLLYCAKRKKGAFLRYLTVKDKSTEFMQEIAFEGKTSTTEAIYCL